MSVHDVDVDAILVLAHKKPKWKPILIMTSDAVFTVN